MEDSKSIVSARRDPVKNKSLVIAVLGVLLLQPATGWSKGGHSGGRASSSSHGSSRGHSGGTSHRGGSHTSAYSHRSASSRFSSTAPASSTRRSTAGASTTPRPSTSSRTSASSTGAADAAGQHTGKGYVNSRGHWVPSPTRTADGKPPRGASARCSDGSYSFSQSHRGTCSHHGGVASWLHY